jgi:allantoate deiminase
MTEEEGGRFGSGVWGSRAMTGNVSKDEIYRGKDKKGISKAQALEGFGIDPSSVNEAARKKGTIKAFLELHVEQGPVLEQKGVDTGIVNSIVGIRTFFVTVWGNADHAGTTPMEYRKDALTGASRVIAGLDPTVRKAGNGAVGTVGMLNLEPGAFNIVPEKVEFSIDLRCSDGETIDSVAKNIKGELEQVCADIDLKYQWEEKLSVPPVIIDPAIISIFRKAAEEKNISTHVMSSGAGHDAMVMASIAPVGMIFVPSRNGKSHCPEEWTDYDKLAKGAELMLGAVLRLAE